MKIYGELCPNKKEMEEMEEKVKCYGGIIEPEENTYILSKNQFLGILSKTSSRKLLSYECLSKFHLDYFAFLYYQKKYKIKEWRRFLAQVIHESNSFKYRIENHNYSTKRILEVFPKYFKTEKEASKYQYSSALFDKVYANRMGNGDEDSQDGSRYRGRGYIQLTGKNNYKKYGYLDVPFFLDTKSGAWESACKYWVGNKLDNCKNIKESTKKINGGYNGLADRERIFDIVLTVSLNIG